MPWKFNQDAYNAYNTNMADWAKNKVLEYQQSLIQNTPTPGSGRTARMKVNDRNSLLANYFNMLYRPSSGMNQFWEYQKTPAEEAMEQQMLEQMRQGTRAGEEDYWNRKNANTEATIKPFGSILSQAWWAKARPGTYGGDMETGYSQRNAMDMANRMEQNKYSNMYNAKKAAGDYDRNNLFQWLAPYMVDEQGNPDWWQNIPGYKTYRKRMGSSSPYSNYLQGGGK